MKRVLRIQLTCLTICVLVSGTALFANAGNGPAPKATGDYGYVAFGLRRANVLEAHDGDPVGKDDSGHFEYSDANGDWYTVEIECVNVAGDYAYMAGEVKTASRSSWIGNWVSWAVYDGGEPGSAGDGIWGIFTNKTTAISNCDNEVLPGPKFTVDTGNLQVHD
jgi:hypothetical protein